MPCSQIAELRLLLRDVVQVGREAKAHETSLREVAQEIASSESSLKTQDYKQMLQTKREHVLNNQQCAPNFYYCCNYHIVNAFTHAVIRMATASL
jgi:hypothetical protein